VAIWEHFPLSSSFTRLRGRLTRRLGAALASLIVTLTECDRNLYPSLYSSAAAIVCIPNIVQSPGATVAVRRKEVLAMGRLSHQKGFDLLLQAWSLVIKRLPDWSLRIVGDGQMHDELLQLANTLGIERHVTLVPFSDNPFALYSACEIFVLSSRFEGLPFVLVEAMSCGSPCISFDCPTGPRELIRQDVNGILVPAERVELLADAIVDLGQKPQLRQRLGEAAQSISERFSEASVAARWHDALCRPGRDAIEYSPNRLGKRLAQPSQKIRISAPIASHETDSNLARATQNVAIERL
jgi:glycosyltransferase involved in cell wall biosynthesis